MSTYNSVLLVSKYKEESLVKQIQRDLQLNQSIHVTYSEQEAFNFIIDHSIANGNNAPELIIFTEEDPSLDGEKFPALLNQIKFNNAHRINLCYFPKSK